MNFRIFGILGLSITAFSLVACGDDSSSSNSADDGVSEALGPMEMLTTPEQEATAKTLKDIAKGKLYSIEYNSDYLLDDAIETGASHSSLELVKFVYSRLLKLPTSQAAKAKIDAGCSAFCVKTPDGDVICGRNFDYRFVSSANVLVQNTPISKGEFKSLSIAAMPFLDAEKFVAGSLSDGKMDISPVIAVPYLGMDGMNDKGVFISVLSLDGGKGGAAQHEEGKKPITPSVGIRFVLDRAESVEDALDIFKSHNFFADGDSSAKSYHFIIGDATGHTVLLEYIQPDGKKEWVMNVMDGQNFATNMYMSEGWETFGVGADRLEKIRKKLDEMKNVLTEEEAMDLLQAVSQELDPKEVTSNTQWSAVYNLTKKTVTICVDKDFTQKYDFAL